MAVSALRISQAASRAPVTSTATPALTRVDRVAPSMRRGLSNARTTRWATTRAAASSVIPSRRIANSSPPRRAIVASARTQARSRSATATSRRSPASCPWASLTRLKSSTSITTMPSMPGSRWKRATACVARSLSRARLASPVSGSWKARRRSSDSRCLRSVTSVRNPFQATATPSPSRSRSAWSRTQISRPSRVRIRYSRSSDRVAASAGPAASASSSASTRWRSCGWMCSSQMPGTPTHSSGR